MPTPVAPDEKIAGGAEQSSQAAIVFENVSIAFEGKTVLESISFTLERGETKSILGVAGSGKSTILKLVLGLIKPDQGCIYVLGEEVTGWLAIGIHVAVRLGAVVVKNREVHR